MYFDWPILLCSGYFLLAHIFIYFISFQCFICLYAVLLCRQVRSASLPQITRTVYTISDSSEPEPQQKPLSIFGKILQNLQEDEQRKLPGLRLCSGQVTEQRRFPGHIPEFLTHADCSASCPECQDTWRPVLYRVPVMVPTESGTQKYIQDTELVATACVCL